MKQTALVLPGAHDQLMPKLLELEKELDEIDFAFRGLNAKASWEEVPPADMPMYRRLNSIINTQIQSTSNITSTSSRSFEILKNEFPPVLEKAKAIAEVKIKEVREMMDELNAPYTSGRIPSWN